MQAAALRGDGYRGKPSPHSPGETFQGVTVLKALKVCPRRASSLPGAPPHSVTVPCTFCSSDRRGRFRSGALGCFSTSARRRGRSWSRTSTWRRRSTSPTPTWSAALPSTVRSQLLRAPQTLTPACFHPTLLLSTSGKQGERADLSHPVHADNCLLVSEMNECVKEPPAYTHRDYR